MSHSKRDSKRLPTRAANTAGARSKKARVADDDASLPPPKRPRKTAENKEKVPENEQPTHRLNVFVFGDGESGELGLGSGSNATLVRFPRLNPFLDPEKTGVVSLDCGGMHTVALTHDNKVLTWGINDDNLLLRDTVWNGGLRDANDSGSDDDGDLNPLEATPTAIPAKNLPSDAKFVQVAAGDSATFLLTENGHVYGWGAFRDDKGDHRFSIHPKTGQLIAIQKELMLIHGLNNIKMLSAGPDFVLALDSTGSVYSWGSDLQGQLGRRIYDWNKLDQLIPSFVRFPRRNIRVKSIHTGSNHAFAIDSNGDTWAWGLNNFGQTGITEGAGEGGSFVSSPQLVPSLVGKKLKTVSGGNHHSIAITGDGTCLTWGRLDGGQSGIDLSTIDINDSKLVTLERGKPRVLLQPTVVPIPDCVSAASGSDHNLAVTATGRVYSWGFNGTRQCGQGNDEDVLVAKLMEGKAIREEKIIWAGAGGQYSMIASAFDGSRSGVINGTK